MTVIRISFIVQGVRLTSLYGRYIFDLVCKKGGENMDTKGIVLWAGLIIICAIIYLVSRKMKKEIEENGIETTGVISRITDEGGTDNVDLQYYVRYCTSEGEELEGLLSNPRADLIEGQQVRLKYHPKYKTNARLID